MHLYLAFSLSFRGDNFFKLELVMQYTYMNIHVHIEDHVVNLVDIDCTTSPCHGYVHSANFTIKGTRLGITTLYVSSLLIYMIIFHLQSALVVVCLCQDLVVIENLKLILDNRSVLPSNLDRKF